MRVSQRTVSGSQLNIRTTARSTLTIDVTSPDSWIARRALECAAAAAQSAERETKSSPATVFSALVWLSPAENRDLNRI